MNSVLILVYTMSLLVVTGKGSNPLARTFVLSIPTIKVLNEGGLFLFWGREEMEEEEQSNQYKETSIRRKL